MDAGGAPVQVTLNASNGVITLSGTGGLAFTSGDGTADADMTFTGTLPAINAALNGLVFTPNLDYNGLAFIQLTTNDLGASGAGGALSDTDLATIDVLPVNDAPNGTDTTVTLNEDSTYTFGAGDFGFNDVDFGDAMTEVRIDSISLPAGATLMLGGDDVAAGKVIPVADIIAATLVFTPVPDANGAGYACFTFSVRDTGVPPGPLFDLAPNTMTVNVTPVNDLPVITSDGGGATAAFVVAENTTAVTTATATDIDLQPLTFSLAGVDAGLFSIDSVTGVLTFNPAPNFEAPGDAGGDNVYNVTVRVSDGAGGIDTQALTITVTDANDAPTAGDDAYVTDEDLPLSIAAAGVLGERRRRGRHPDHRRARHRPGERRGRVQRRRQLRLHAERELLRRRHVHLPGLRRRARLRARDGHASPSTRSTTRRRPPTATSSSPRRTRSRSPTSTTSTSTAIRSTGSGSPRSRSRGSSSSTASR